MYVVLQCFDAVGCAAGRASGCKKLSGGILAWLSVWGMVHICILPSWCHCHSLSLALVNPDWFYVLGFTFLLPAHPDSPGQSPEGHKTVVVVLSTLFLDFWSMLFVKVYYSLSLSILKWFYTVFRSLILVVMINLGKKLVCLTTLLMSYWLHSLSLLLYKWIKEYNKRITTVVVIVAKVLF